MMADRLFSAFIHGCTALVLCALVWITSDVFIEGSKHITWSFLYSEPIDAGRAGGIGPILVSTFWILSIALAIALPLGLGIAIWLSEFAPFGSRHKEFIGITLDVLAGVPSIVYGLFGNALFCIYLKFGYSILSGGLTLACMILPVFARTCEVGLRNVDDQWRQGALALGMTRSTAIWQILLPAARPAILAGFVLSIGRTTAETAALLFTSGYVNRMPESWFDSGRALSIHIYDLAMNVTGGNGPAYASALVLLALIVLFNAIAQSLTDIWIKRRIKPI